MKLVTAEGMRAIDHECIENRGIEGLALMEDAGAGTARFIARELGSPSGRTIAVVCGKGNNGGDGFVIARELQAGGARVSVHLVGRVDDVTGDARTNLDRLGRENIVEVTGEETVDSLSEAMAGSDVVVDALFGTGFEGEPKGLFAGVIARMNLCGRPILAVDVPSGLNATTGRAEGECVSATWTCTMGLPKAGFYIGDGRAQTGHVHVVDIGVPSEVVEAAGIHDNVLTMEEAAALLPERPSDGHKGTFGKIVVVAGSVGYTGAAALASMSALRSGAGLVTLGTPASLNDIMEIKLTEVITRPLPETKGRSLSRGAVPAIMEMLETADALAIGPGVSRDSETADAVRAVVGDVTIPCVVDADGLNALSIDGLAGRAGDAPLVLTPHPGEMSRLTGYGLGDIQSGRSEVAREVARESGATVVLKGAGTVTAGPDGELFLNPTGNDGLGSAGVGDVLTGVIAALLGRGMTGLHASALGAFVHGLAGDLAVAGLGRAGMIAGDVLEMVPEALVLIERNGR